MKKSMHLSPLREPFSATVSSILEVHTMLSFRTSAVVLFAIVTIALFPSIAAAQADINQPPGEPLQINVRNVLVDVVVIDKKGAAVSGLHREDFEVLENGKPQKVRNSSPSFMTNPTKTPRRVSPPAS